LKNVYVKGDTKMKLTPPKVITWWVAVILGVLALLGHFNTVAALSPYAFWLAFAGLALLAIACLVKNL
jgi:tryptophan-rich sensory protein